MSATVALTSFLLIAAVELPDKTLIATLVLATRYRPLHVWVGVGLAFAVQCIVAVAFGGLISRLPERPITLVAGLLFLTGAVLLWRGAGHADQDEARTEAEYSGKVTPGATGLRAVGASFLVLFVAEWGDLSQLLSAGLVVRYHDPGSVFVGSWAALLAVSGVAVLLGRALLRRVRLSTVRRVGGGTCALLGVATLLASAGLPTPL